jgi:hypothetical protein
MGNIIYNVALAVLVIDDFNDKVLSGPAVQVKVTDSADKPIRKQDGYFVFLAGKNEIRQIEVDAHFYNKEIVQIEPWMLQDRRPILRVRLRPNRMYALPGGATVLEGKAAPGSEIQAIPETRAKALKLLYDYEKGKGEGREIHLFQSDKKDLAGKRFAVRGKEGDEPEVFHVMEMTDVESGACMMAEPLQKEYKKAGTSIFPVCTAKADEKGEYFLLLPGVEGKEACPCQIRISAAKGKTANVELTPGQSNKVDLV